MAVTYNKLFTLLEKRNITTAQLQRMAGYSANITTRLKGNVYISMESLEKICKALNCDVNDVIDFI